MKIKANEICDIIQGKLIGDPNIDVSAFSNIEKETAIDSGYKIIKTGPRLLRTETAPIMAISILQYLYGDLAN